MKKRIKNAALSVLSAALIISMLAGCSSSNKSAQGASSAVADMALSSGSTSENGAEYENTSEKAPDEAALNDGGQNNIAERKIIRTINISFETLEFDKFISDVQSVCDEYGGYIENSSVSGRSSYDDSYNSSRYADISLRVPKDKADEFCTRLSDSGNILHRSDSTEDVTLNYIDTESRKKSLELQQERLLALLESAESLEDIISLEERLSQVRYELESTQSQLNYLDNKVDYTTIILSISEASRYTVSPKTFADRVSNGFKNTLDNIGSGAVDFAVWFTVNIPYFVIIAVPVSLIVFIFKKRSKKKHISKVNKAAPENTTLKNNSGDK